MTSLKNKTVSGFKWQVILQITTKALSVGTFAVLARILEPSVFGLFALAFVAIDGLSLFKAFGIDAGIIQRKDTNDTIKSTAFWMVTISGTTVFLTCFILAPFAADFFRNHDAASVIRALGIIFVVNGFGKIPSALLTRDMKFKAISIIQLVGGIVNSVCAIGFALLSPSVWSLVLAYLAKTVVMDVLSWYHSGFRLRWAFDKKVAKEFLSFGSILMAGGLVGYITENINNIAVGRLLGTTKVGYMALANNVASFINTHFTYLILRVLFPAYSSIQDDKPELQRVYLKILKYISLFTIPFCLALAILSRELVLTLYGEKWLMIIPIMQVAAFIQLFASIVSGAGPLYMACGRPKYALHLALAGLTVRIPLVIFMTQTWGLMGTILSDLLTNMLLAPLSILLVRKTIAFSWGDFWKALKPSLLCSGLMSAAIVGFKFLAQMPFLEFFSAYPFALLLACTVVGCLTYGIAIIVFDKSSYKEVKELIFRLGKGAV